MSSLPWHRAIRNDKNNMFINIITIIISSINIIININITADMNVRAKLSHANLFKSSSQNPFKTSSKAPVTFFVKNHSNKQTVRQGNRNPSIFDTDVVRFQVYCDFAPANWSI